MMRSIPWTHVLVTGFPGFLACRLVQEMAKSRPHARFSFLVLPSMVSVAHERLAAYGASFQSRADVVVGDISLPCMGLGSNAYGELAKSVDLIWHMAAIYDLAVSRDVAFRVNLTGTIQVLEFAQRALRLKRLNYVSTCYVSGKRTGDVLESELVCAQRFKNHYEETKFWAEVEVQRRMEQIPTAIFRPGIVVGDSRTGATDKYDGPYYIFGLLERLPMWAPITYIGRSNAYVNIVPIDFVVDALSYLGAQEEAHGKVYQIADPEPMRARDLLAMASKSLGRKHPVASVPQAFVRSLLTSSYVEGLVGVPRQALEYFTHDARYDTVQMERALLESSIRCPRLSSYLPTLLHYMEHHPRKSFLDRRRI